MDFTMLVLLSVLGPIFILLGIIVSKMVALKELPDSRYTPFDHITGQTSVEFHEEKDEEEEEAGQGDDKNKNKGFQVRL